MENLICVCGPRGAGKETLLNAILSSSHGRLLRRVVPFTTRKRRDQEQHGREYYFLSKDVYSTIKSADTILYSVQIGIGVGSYTSGTTKSEFDRHEDGIMDVTVEGARTLCRYSSNSLLLFVYASPEERCRRIMKRQNMSEAEALALMQNEPSPGSPDTMPELYPDFIILENRDGTEVQILLSPVYDFLKASVAV